MSTTVDTNAKNRNYFSTIQKGYLYFQEKSFSQAYMLVGFSQKGKTVSAHHLCHSKLKAIKQLGSLIYQTYQQSKFKNCIIGNSRVSETQIPNIFQYDQSSYYPTYYQNKATIIDLPGFGDSLGIHRIISNGYFQYLTFSKVKQLKFILIIDANCLQGTGEQLLSTFVKFFQFFKKYENVKTNIQKAVCLLVTKVQSFTTTEDIKLLLNYYLPLLQQKTKAPINNWIKDMLSSIINNNKIFIFAKPTAQNQINLGDDTLKRMNAVTTYWSLPVLKDKTVDMSAIQYSVSGQVLNELNGNNLTGKHKQDLQALVRQSRIRIEDMLFKQKNSSSIKNVINSLKQDCSTYKSFQSSIKLQNIMNQLNIKYYCHLQSSLEDKRTTMQNKMFGYYLTSSNQYVEKPKYFMKKIVTLQKIFQKMKKYAESPAFLNNQPLITDKCQCQFLNITEEFIKQFIKLMSSLIIPQNKENKCKIYQYGYLLHRVIRQVQIIYMVLFQNLNKINEFGQKESLTSQLLIKYDIKDKIFNGLDFNVKQVKIANIKALKLSEFTHCLDQQIVQFLMISGLNGKKHIQITASIIQRFKDITTITYKCKKQIHYFESIMISERNLYQSQINKKQPILCSKLFDIPPINQKNQHNLIKAKTSLTEQYSDFTNQLSHSNSTQFNLFQECNTIFFQISNTLAEHYANTDRIQNAIQLYKSVNNYEEVINCYSKDLPNYTKRQDILDFYLRFGIEAANCCRYSLSLECFQKAYSKAWNSTQIRKCSEMIVTVLIDGKNKQVLDRLVSSNMYFKRFYQDQFMTQFSPLDANTKSSVSTSIK